MEKPVTYTVAIALLVLDQVTKHLARTGAITFDAGWFAFTHTTNTGAAFGLFTGLNPVFIAISIVALAFLWWYYHGELAILAIGAGITGNLIDRVLLGHVTDFINFKIWPVFNIADSCIVLGVLFLIYQDLTDTSENS